MHALLLSIFCSLTLAATLSIVGVMLADRWLKLRGVTIVEGGRHYLAIVYGLLAGVPLGGWLGMTFVARLIEGSGGRLGTIIVALIAATGGALFAGVPGFMAGYRLAEALGVSNGILVRPFWAFLRFAVPAAIVGAMGGFWFGWSGCHG
jgi:hypothetical protein